MKNRLNIIKFLFIKKKLFYIIYLLLDKKFLNALRAYAWKNDINKKADFIKNFLAILNE